MKKHLLLFAMLLLISAGAKAQINVEPDSLSFTYNVGQGPSIVQPITISAEEWTGDSLIIKLYSTSQPSDFAFEISNNQNDSFVDSLSIRLTEGNVDTTVFVRMKEGLEVGVYDDTIRIESSDTSFFNVVCHGLVSTKVSTPAITLLNSPQSQPEGPVGISIGCETEDVTIYYTIGESPTDPTPQDTKYEGPFLITESTTIKAIAYKEGEDVNVWEPSEVASSEYTIFYFIEVTIEPEESGTVNNQGPLSVAVNYNDPYTLKARPYEGYLFEKWEDGEYEHHADEYTIEQVQCHHDIKAHFKHKPYIVIATPEPSQGGNVEVDGPYETGGDAVLTAQPNLGWHFSHWQDEERQNPRTINNINENMSFIAYFDEDEYNFDLTSNNPDWGHVVFVDNNGPFHYNDNVKIKAIETDSTEFIRWNDGINTNPRQVTITRDTMFTAIFSQKIMRINVVADPPEGGVVSGGGDYIFNHHCIIRAQANVNEGYSFINWTENGEIVSREPEYSFNVSWIDSNRTFVAHFAKIPVVDTIETPETICDNEPLTLVTPEYGNATIGKWQLSPDTTFVNALTYQGEKLGQRYNGWYLRYTVYNDLDSVSSNVITITVQSFIDENEIDEVYAKGPDDCKYMLIYPSSRDGFHYQWYRDDNLIQGATGQYFYKQGGLDNGDYKVYISYNDDVICGAFSPVIEVNNTNTNPSRLFVYPNPSPSGSHLVIENDDEGESHLSIYALDGKLLHSQTVTGVQATVDISLPQGIYVARLTNGHDIKVEKIVIQ